MKKTFYSVEYCVMGAYKNHTAWFDNLSEAQEFAKRDYTGKVVKHTYKTEKGIKEAEYAVRMFKEN